MAHSNQPHVILIDGRSGVGKTTLAMTMADALGASVVHLDDVYPGWGGLVAGRDAVIDGVLVALRHARTARIRRWDWEHGVPGFDVIVPASEIVILEGCGISTERSREMADVSIWVECDESTRRERQAQRDGDAFDAYLDLWESQVNDHIASDNPIDAATVVVTS